VAKILWHSDAGSHTGFGTVTHAVAERLVKDYGHDIHVLAINYQGDYIDTNLKLYLPTKLERLDAYGQSRMVEMIAELEPDVIVMLNDPHVIRKIQHRNKWDTEKVLLRYRPDLEGFLTPVSGSDEEGWDYMTGVRAHAPRTLAYMPVDGTNLPKMWDDLNVTTQPVLMSSWGKTWLPDAPLVYHGVDTDQFRPASEKTYTSSGGLPVRSKRDAKVALGYDPDKFLVLRIDRNSERKNFAGTWKALLPVMRKYEDIIVHFHCKSQGDMGVELPQLFSRAPDLEDRFYTPGHHGTTQGWPVDDLAILYNAADLFISTSWAEGFGLTLAESLACGVPIIAQDCSSITEVTGPGAIRIDPIGLITVTQGQDQWLPDIPAFSEAIEELYLDRKKREELGQAGLKHVREKFSWDVAARQFDQLINQLVEDDNG
jgi:glycosyltransferase involved in cell wall biosynthesis